MNSDRRVSVNHCLVQATLRGKRTSEELIRNLQGGDQEASRRELDS